MLACCRVDTIYMSKETKIIQVEADLKEVMARMDEQNSYEDLIVIENQYQALKREWIQLFKEIEHEQAS